MSALPLPGRTPPDPALLGLRAEVRAFLDEARERGTFTPSVDSWLTGWDPDFSRELGERGWLGMTVPSEYGGRGRTHVERFAVTEELLRAGAPVAAHWIADRQVAPNLLRYGNETLKRRYLPAIAEGRCFFGIGMSEPDSGSDLASVRTRARHDGKVWRVDGTKLWTSGAHRAHAFVALVRTSPLDTGARHAGLSQLLIELDSPGVEVRPVVSASGDHHFNEVVLDSVAVPDEQVVGRIGDGWTQVTSELAFERSGPERFLSTWPLLEAGLADPATRSRLERAAVGRNLARYSALHHMSSAVAAALQRDERADVAASLVKLLGTGFEGDVAEWIEQAGTGAGEPVAGLARTALHQRPGFTLRGGTNEILSGVAARGLGMR